VKYCRQPAVSPPEPKKSDKDSESAVSAEAKPAVPAKVCKPGLCEQLKSTHSSHDHQTLVSDTTIRVKPMNSFKVSLFDGDHVEDKGLPSQCY